MASNTSYEILTQRGGKWEVEGVTEDKEYAKEQALESLGTGHYQAVKVLGEKMDPATGESTTFTVLNKVDQRKGGAEEHKGPDRRMKKDRRKVPERRKKKDRRKKKKSKGSLVGTLVQGILFIWAFAATAAFFTCFLGK